MGENLGTPEARKISEKEEIKIKETAQKIIQILKEAVQILEITGDENVLLSKIEEHLRKIYPKKAIDKSTSSIWEVTQCIQTMRNDLINEKLIKIKEDKIDEVYELFDKEIRVIIYQLQVKAD